MIYGIALAGIALTLLAVRLTGGRRDARIADLVAARRRLAEDRPGLPLSAGILSADGKVAVFSHPGGLALVFAVGDRLATRVVTRQEIAHMDIDAGGTLTIATDSFTHPTFRLTGIDRASGEAPALLAMVRTGREAA